MWVLPPLVLLAVYWQGLGVWFHDDDFTLLLTAQLPTHEFWPQLQLPRAQGTFRPLSERIFFHAFHGWFGLNAVPYRLLVFATQIINLWLLALVARRLTQSQIAATVAACVWAAHHGLAVSLSWSSAYNQALYSFFVLLSLWLFMKFAETGSLWLYASQWLTFLIGFGALETIVVYPAVVIAWCVFFRRERLLWALPMLLGSAVLAWFQFSGLSAERPEVYRLVLTPGALIDTLLYYLRSAFAGHQVTWFAVVVGMPLAVASIYEAAKGRWTAVLGWSWFLVALAPFLPLAAHLSDYYLFLPAAGLAVAAGATVSQYWPHSWQARLSVTVILSLWTATTIGYGRAEVTANYRKSIEARDLVSQLKIARAAHPNKTLLLVGINDVLYGSAIYHQLFRAVGLFNVYLAPEDGRSVEHVLRADEIQRGLDRGWLVVYDAATTTVRDITDTYHP